MTLSGEYYEQDLRTITIDPTRYSRLNVFVCEDNTVISKFFICDGIADCQDGQDETGCTVHNLNINFKFINNIEGDISSKDDTSQYFIKFGLLPPNLTCYLLSQLSPKSFYRYLSPYN